MRLSLSIGWLAVVALLASTDASWPKNAAVRHSTSDKALLKKLPGFKEDTAEVNGVRIHYVFGGTGRPLVLLPGWPETWWEYHKIMPELAKTRMVISVDLRGMGTSSKPAGGYDKKTMAADIAGLVKHLNIGPVDILGHDIGSMVAFSYAANFPDLTRRVVMIDVPHPDPELAKWPLLPAVGQFQDKVGDGSHAYAWWFAYHQVKGLPEELAANGRIRLEQDWFFHYLTKNDASISELDRQVYAAAYSDKNAMRAGNAWYQAFPQDIIDYTKYEKVGAPILAIGGPGYGWLKASVEAKATNVRTVRVDSGHFIPEEVPTAVLQHLADFLN